MTAPHDLDRQLQAFLQDGPTELPDPSFDAVRDRTETTRQRVFIGPWRIPNVNKIVPIGLGAAAVVVALVVGSQLLLLAGVGAAPSASPSATAEPSASPSAASGLPVGSSYRLDDEPPIQVTIPAPGWVENKSGSLVKTDGSPNGILEPDGAYTFGAWGGEPLVPSDPCRWASTMPDTPATTLDEIASALASQATRDASVAANVTVDGHPGKSITLHIPGDIAFNGSRFTDCDEGKFCTMGFPSEAGCHMYYQGPDEFQEIWIVEVDGEFLFQTGNYWPETPPEVVEEVGALLGSMSFEPKTP